MIFTYGFLKLSVIYFYRRILVTGTRTLTIITNIAIIVTVLWTLGFGLAQIFSGGSHFEYNWGLLGKENYCAAALPESEGLLISDFITDFVIFFLPFHW